MWAMEQKLGDFSTLLYSDNRLFLLDQKYKNFESLLLIDKKLCAKSN